MALQAGSQLGPYQIQTLIGVGGMGEVYRARDSRLNRNVAIKILPSQFSSDKVRLRRFEQEAQAAGMLNHPNILAVYDVGTQDGSLYVVSELLDGTNLREVITGLSQRKAIEYAAQIAHGLAAAHEKGIVHRREWHSRDCPSILPAKAKKLDSAQSPSRLKAKST